jgi:hypothetical protein
MLEEDRTRYCVEWEPVGSAAQCDRKWESEHYANAVLVADWEERERASLGERSKPEREDVSIRIRFP